MISFTTFLAICYLTSSFWFILNNRGFHFFFLNDSSEKLWNKYFLDCCYYQWMTSPLSQNLKNHRFCYPAFYFNLWQKIGEVDSSKWYWRGSFQFYNFSFFLKVFLFQLQLINIGMLIIYIPPEGRLSCPACTWWCRAKNIDNSWDWRSFCSKNCQENLFLLGSKMQC